MVKKICGAIGITSAGASDITAALKIFSRNV
jgi:hypothetical protein